MQPEYRREGYPLYYNVDRTLSRDRLFNFVIGARGAGKTYGAKDRAIKNYLKKGEQFVYLRRYETEMPAAEMANFFDDIAEKYPDHQFTCSKGVMRCNGDVFGWYFPLSKATMLKSIPFPHVSLIIFDEFIIDVGMQRYLQREVQSFLECYSTISRDRDVKVLFLSNAISFTNPYFLYFELSLEHGQSLKLLPDISLELVQNQDFIEHQRQTRFGRLVEGTAYGDYAIANRFLRDTDTFVEKMSETSYYICTLRTESTNYGVYRGEESGLYYVTEKVDPTAPIAIALKLDSHNVDTIFGKKGGFILKTLVDAYCSGNMRFDNITCKNVLTPLLKKIM